jgi:hypothetical protein
MRYVLLQRSVIGSSLVLVAAAIAFALIQSR